MIFQTGMGFYIAVLVEIGSRKMLCQMAEKSLCGRCWRCEFISGSERDLLRICHQQYCACTHVVDVCFKSLLRCCQRKAFVNWRLQISPQKRLRLSGKLQHLDEILFAKPICEEPAVEMQILDQRSARIKNACFI